MYFCVVAFIVGIVVGIRLRNCNEDLIAFYRQKDNYYFLAKERSRVIFGARKLMVVIC